MKVYTLLMRIESEDDVNADQIREELYDATEDVNFGFDITSITEVADQSD